ncbi:MAG: metal-dependent hydrolase [Halovenus sp.]
MPSTIVHLAFAGLLAAALLGEAYDRKAVALVLLVVAFPDLDSFVALYWEPAHRAALHTLVIPLVAAFILWIDVRVREHSFVLERWGWRGFRVAWVALLCLGVAGMLLDMTDGSVNLFWPLHDQFYALNGKIELSDQRGLVQTFVESEGPVPSPSGVGSTEDVVQSTGVDPAPVEEGDPERIFPVIGATWELLVLVFGTAVTLARFEVSHARPD